MTTLAPFIFVLIFFIIAGNENMHKSWDEFEFPLEPELPVLERRKNQCIHFFLVAIVPILFKLADIEEMHDISDEFEFQPD